MKSSANETKVVYTRAQAAERVLERKRIGLECAIEALEAVGYGVAIDSQGRYRVIPPSGQILIPADGNAGAQVDRESFLGEYPHMLTPTLIAEIMGCSATHIRALCNEGKLPAVKVGKGRWYIPKPHFIEMLAAKGGVLE